MADRYASKLGELDARRVKRIAKQMTAQNWCTRYALQEREALMASETRLRFLVIGLCLMAFPLLGCGGHADGKDSYILLADAMGDTILPHASSEFEDRMHD
jgi:hypothetical protein